MGCAEGNEIEPDTDYYEAVALRNGESWNAEVRVIKLDTNPSSFALRFGVYNDLGFRRETFNIDGFLPVIGTQTLLSADRDNIKDIYSDYFTWAADGDALLDMYVLDTAQSHNLLTIHEYDPNNLEIKGAFSTTLILSLRGSDERDPPGKVVFSQGEFTAKVEPGWFD